LAVEVVILHKLIAGRPRDIGDLEAVLVTRPRLDLPYLEQWADQWDVRGTWESLRSRFP
jgi:hypothetical protein